MANHKYDSGKFIPIALLGNVQYNCHPVNMFQNFQFMIRNQDTGEDFTLINLVISYFDRDDGLMYYRSIEGSPSSTPEPDFTSLLTHMLKVYLGDFLFEAYCEGLALVQWFEEKSVDRLGDGAFVRLFSRGGVV